MKYLICVIMLLFSSCISELTTEPEFEIGNIEDQTTPLSDTAKALMNGVYKVEQGSDIFGDVVVGKWIGKRWCLYSNHDVVFSENAGGLSGIQILFEGYIKIVRSGRGASIDMSIQPEDGADSLLRDRNPINIILRGVTSDNEQIILKRVRDLHLGTRNVEVIAHRGGGRNSERLGRSENSLEMIKYAQILGATGIEIDVRPTRDRKLIVFHDDTFSPRTVQGAYLLGEVGNFDMAQIKLFGKLIYGESIPTLDETLETVIDSTILTTVWLDIKDPSIVYNVIAAQTHAINYARSRGRDDLKIYIGCPEQNVLDAYLSCTNRNDSNLVLIEFSCQTAGETGACKVWAPRWTNGIPQNCSGKKIFVWTLDVRDFIFDFLNSESVDGILSNYPSLVAGIKYLGNQ